MSDDCIFKAYLAPHVKYVPLYNIHGTQRYQPSSMCRYTTYTAHKDTNRQACAGIQHTRHTKIPNQNDEHRGNAKTAAYFVKQNDRSLLDEREIGAGRM